MAEVWEPLTLTHATCVSGGFLGKPTVIETRQADFDGELVSLVLVGAQVPWLAQAVCKKNKSSRPFARVRVFDDLRKSASPAVADDADTGQAIVDSKMAELTSSEPAGQPSSKKPRRPVAKKGIHITKVDMPPAVAEDGPDETTPNRRVGRSRLRSACDGEGPFLVGVEGKKLFIEIGALNLLLRRIRDELTSGGVDPVLQVDSSPEKPTISWDFRDEAWVFKPRQRDGRNSRQSVSVRRRMAAGKDLEGLTFEAARKTVYAEFVANIGFFASDASAVAGVA